MSFTYDPTSLKTDQTSRVRFEIGDTKEDSGVLPDGSNFQDEEIEYYLEKNPDFESGVAELFEVLAGRWSTQVDYRMGPLSESNSQVAKAFREQAKSWREKSPGYQGACGVPFIPDDGYSNDHPTGTIWGPDTDYQQHV